MRDPELDAVLDDDQGLAPEELLLESYEFGTLVELRYAGANGTSTEQVTVAELDDAVATRRIRLLGWGVGFRLRDR